MLRSASVCYRWTRNGTVTWLNSLHLKATFHRVRQNGIDEELFDVVSGFEALSKGKTRRSAKAGEEAEMTAGSRFDRIQ